MPIPLATLDIAIFLASIAVVLGIGLWAGRKEETAADFYLVLATKASMSLYSKRLRAIDAGED